MAVSAENKRLAKHVVGALGGTPEVYAHRHDDYPDVSIDILYSANVPSRDFASYGTLGLSDYPLMKQGKELPVRVELVGACASTVEQFPNALATAAFFVMRDGWFCRPGVVFETLLAMCEVSKTMKHLYFTAPSQWPSLNKTLKLSSKTVTWLWAIPISDKESNFIKEHGDEEFETLLEKNNTDVLNINRRSIV